MNDITNYLTTVIVPVATSIITCIISCVVAVKSVTKTIKDIKENAQLRAEVKTLSQVNEGLRADKEFLEKQVKRAENRALKIREVDNGKE